MSRQTSRNLRGGIGLEFSKLPTGLEVAAALIPAHQKLSEEGFTSPFPLPFVRTLIGTRFSMELKDDKEPRLPDRLEDTCPFIFQLREIRLLGSSENGAATGATDQGMANVEVTAYTNRRHRSPYLTRGGLVDKLVIAPDMLSPDVGGVGSDVDQRIRLLAAAQKATQVVAATITEQLVAFHPAQFER